MHKSEIERIKKALDSPEAKARLLKSLQDQRAKEDAMLWYFYPEHKGHSYTFHDEKYFDAMFMWLQFECCGQVLTLTRDMVDIYNEREEIGLNNIDKV